MGADPDPGIADGVLGGDVRSVVVVVVAHGTTIEGGAWWLGLLCQNGNVSSAYRPLKTAGPWTWMVLWGEINKATLRRCEVTAFDADEALTEGALRHPEWHRPRVAFILDGPSVPGPED